MATEFFESFWPSDLESEAEESGRESAKLARITFFLEKDKCRITKTVLQNSRERSEAMKTTRTNGAGSITSG